jgi:hypothetical protein
VANAIHVVALCVDIEELEHLDPQMWDRLYKQDRQHSADGVRVEDRGIQCAGICRSAGVVAWMYLRQVNGQRQAVHQHAEDEARHQGPARSPEHIAYQERIAVAAESGGFRAGTEVRTPTGPRGWIQTDTLVEGEGGRRIGWEVQLSTAPSNGPKSVRTRADKAQRLGIIPAWHTDRDDYARRNDTQWTFSNRLPANVIAKTSGLRVVSGFRVLDFWMCDARALYPCPEKGWRRCGKPHATPKPRDVLFDDLVRKTAAGLIVPLDYRNGSRTHRFWVPADDRARYLNAMGAPEGNEEVPRTASGASTAGPTCRPRERIEVARDASGQPIPPCRFCGEPASLLGPEGQPEHWSCRRRQMGAAA